MNCESAREQIPLYLYGELTAEQEEALDQHLDGCESCRVALEAEKRLHLILDAAAVPPPPDLLEECRTGLLRTVKSRPAATGGSRWRDRLAGWLGFRAEPVPLPLRAAGAGALVAVGFFAARWTAADTPRLGNPGQQPVAVQVRYIEPEPAGRVRIVLEETRQRVLAGSLEDQRIREALLSALRNPVDPGLRAESVDLLKMRAATQEVRDALLYAVEHDPNDGVRLKALEGLRAHAADPECRRVLSRVLLRDRNPGIRSMAIDLLVSSANADVVGTLQELLRVEDNDYLRLRSVRALEALGAPTETF